MHSSSPAEAMSDLCGGGIDGETGAGDDGRSGGEGEFPQHDGPPGWLPANVKQGARAEGWRQPADHAAWASSGAFMFDGLSA
jgi:hypothetical protein